jgi:phosphoglucosamine mutase
MTLFGSSGIRGLVGQEITSSLVLKIGMAVGSEYGRIVIGKDTRTSGDMMERALAAGAMSSGADIFMAGMISTPTLARAAFDYDCGLMITASHNPKEYNGVKMWNPDGSAFDTNQMERIEELITKDESRKPSWKDVGQEYLHRRAVRNHIDDVISSVGSSDVSVVVDCACGATYNISPLLLREMGCSVFSINAQPDGYFPGRMPEPTEDQLTDLMRNVVGREANLGIAHDGDGDRMVAVDENGHFVDGDKLLALFASMLGAKGLVAPIDASMVLDDMVKGNVVRTKVGDVYVAEALRKTGLPFGGEPSGTFIFPKETYCPDGVYAAALLAKYTREQRLSEMIDSLPSYPRARESFVFQAANRDVLNEKMRMEMNAVSCNRLITVDGFRAEFDDGWYLIRLSGTEPKLRLSAEARTKDELDRLMGQARTIVKRCMK